MRTKDVRSAKVQASGYFLGSAVFHYLGPSFAVLLFVHVAPTGVAWLRVASAAIVFALWRRPWRVWMRSTRQQKIVYLALGVVLAGMNTVFYLAIARLDLATVGTIEFVGVVAVAAYGTRTARNTLALLVVIAGVAALSVHAFATDPMGLVFAVANAACFAIYIVLGHRIANRPAAGDGTSGRLSGVDQLGVAMLIAAVVISAWGIVPALPAFTHPLWLAWGVGVGVCSSVIPYVTDQLAMAKLSRAAYALMMALLPASAAIIGAVVLGQIPTPLTVAGIALVIIGIAVHSERAPADARSGSSGSGSRPGP